MQKELEVGYNLLNKDKDSYSCHSYPIFLGIYLLYCILKVTITCLDSEEQIYH